MRDADESIQKLLQSLRDAKPAADLERRILIAMQEATEAKRSRRWVWWPASSRLAGAMALTGAAVLALILVFTVVRHPPTITNVSSHPARAEHGQTPNTEAVARKRPGNSVASVMPSSRMMSRVMIRAHSHHAFAHQMSASNSFPAPPLPLTQQERLLLRLARRHDPGSLTILNPEMRGAETARTREQFQQFFAMNEQEMRTQFE